MQAKLQAHLVLSQPKPLLHSLIPAKGGFSRSRERLRVNLLDATLRQAGEQAA